MKQIMEVDKATRVPITREREDVDKQKDKISTVRFKLCHSNNCSGLITVRPCTYVNNILNNAVLLSNVNDVKISTHHPEKEHC